MFLIDDEAEPPCSSLGCLAMQHPRNPQLKSAKCAGKSSTIRGHTNALGDRVQEAGIRVEEQPQQVARLKESEAVAL